MVCLLQCLGSCFPYLGITCNLLWAGKAVRKWWSSKGDTFPADTVWVCCCHLLIDGHYANSDKTQSLLPEEEHRHCSGATSNTVHNITAGILDWKWWPLHDHVKFCSYWESLGNQEPQNFYDQEQGDTLQVHQSRIHPAGDISTTQEVSWTWHISHKSIGNSWHERHKDDQGAFSLNRPNWELYHWAILQKILYPRYEFKNILGPDQKIKMSLMRGYKNSGFVTEIYGNMSLIHG